MQNEELKCDTSKEYNSHDTCFPLDVATSEEDWSLSQIFGHAVKGTCPLADDGIDPICVDVPHSRAVYASQGSQENKDDTGHQRCFGLAPDADFELVLPKQDTVEKSPLEEPKLYAERTFVGYGQERGGLQVILTNPSPTEEVEFVYMESLPWFMKIYLHTLHANIEGSKREVIQEMYYRPALDRKRGTQLEVRMVIPKNATAILTYDFEKAILRYTEYPPDANRGFDVAPAVITIRDVSIRTTSLLLPLPTPDFSMPYNVIILTSTVLALSFGFIFNLMTRRFVAVEEADQWDLRSKRLQLVAALTRLKGKLLKKDKGAKAQ